MDEDKVDAFWDTFSSVSKSVIKFTLMFSAESGSLITMTPRDMKMQWNALITLHTFLWVWNNVTTWPRDHYPIASVDRKYLWRKCQRHLSDGWELYMMTAAGYDVDVEENWKGFMKSDNRDLNRVTYRVHPNL